MSEGKDTRMYSGGTIAEISARAKTDEGKKELLARKQLCVEKQAMFDAVVAEAWSPDVWRCTPERWPIAAEPVGFDSNHADCIFSEYLDAHGSLGQGSLVYLAGLLVHKPWCGERHIRHLAAMWGALFRGSK